VNPDSLLPVTPDPPLPAGSQRSQIQSFLPAHSKSRFSANREATSTPSSMLPESPDPLLPARPVSPLRAKLDPPLLAKPVSPRQSKPDSLLPVCYQRSPFRPYQQCQIHHYLLAATVDSFIPTGEARSTATRLLPQNPASLLPAKRDSALLACS